MKQKRLEMMLLVVADERMRKLEAELVARPLYLSRLPRASSLSRHQSRTRRNAVMLSWGRRALLPRGGPAATSTASVSTTENH